VEVEFRDDDGAWYALSGASAELVFPDSYRVTFSTSTRRIRHASLLEAMVFKVVGRLCSRAYVESADGSKFTLMLLVA
jgi:hypothetical protein